jgi:low temperature requirement protein LtrA
MTPDGRTGLVRASDAPERATLLELLFDVAYVAALAVVSMSLARNVSLAGTFQLLVSLMALWWTWSITALLTDFYNPERLPIQAMIAGTMLGTILMAASLPLAFSTLGLVFAGAYVATHVGRGLVLVSVLREHLARIRAARFLFWFSLSGVAWITGAFTPGWTRVGLWALALTIDYLASGLRFPTPRFGRVPLDQYEQASGHLGERYQQFVILALGHLILVPTLRIGATGFTIARAGAFLIAFATTLLLWQIYLYRAGAFLQLAIHVRPGRITRWAQYTHLFMVAGIVSAAAGFDLVIGRPGGATPASWVAVIFGGPILFLIGRIVLENEVFGMVAQSRLAWLLALIAMAPAMVLLSPILVTVATTSVLLGVVITDAVRAHRGPPGVPELSPPRKLA